MMIEKMKLSKQKRLTFLSYLIVFLLCAGIFLSHYKIIGHAVYGDGIGYWSYLHTLYFDKDLNFLNDFQHYYSPQYNNSEPEVFNPSPINKTETGKVGNFHPPGIIILMPFYIAADMLLILINWVSNFNLLRNGYSDIYQITTGLGAVLFAVLGLFLTEKLLLKITNEKIDKKSIRASVFIIFLASSLIYYSSIDVLNSHFASFFLSSLFFFTLFTIKKGNVKHLILGAIIGLATVTRFQDSLLFIPYLLFLILNREKYIFKNSLKQFLLSFFAFLIIVFPLFYLWMFHYGSFLPNAYSFPKSSFISSLFTLPNGLFSKTPFLLISFIGLSVAIKKYRNATLIFLSFFVAQHIVISWFGGWTAAAYGGRMYLSSLFLFFFLFAILINSFKRKILLVVISFIFICLNLLMILNFMVFEKESSNNSKGLEKSTLIKVEKLLNSF